MKSTEFISQLNKAWMVNTTYATGGFGASIGDYPAQLERYCKNTPSLEKKIRSRAATPPCFAFDCVGLVKGIIWGWNAKRDSVYGGATYSSNGLTDIGTETIIKKCSDVSTDFSKIVPGELLWIEGHVGVYIGNGYAIECTSAWDAKTQKTVVTNIKKAGTGEHGRAWTKHGKLPWIEYEAAKKYNVQIGPFATKAEAEKIQNAIATLGTSSSVVEV